MRFQKKSLRIKEQDRNTYSVSFKNTKKKDFNKSKKGGKPKKAGLKRIREYSRGRLCGDGKGTTKL